MTKAEQKVLLKKLYKNLDDSFDPFANDAYCDFYQDGTNKDPVQNLLDDIDFGESESCHLFSGYSGTGKTTQLRQLARRLGDTHQALFVDGSNLRGEGEIFDIRTLLLLVAGGVSDLLDDLVKQGEITLSGGNFYQRFFDYLKKHKPRFKSVNLDLGFPGDFAKLRLELQGNPTFRDRIRRLLSNSVGEVRQQVLDFFRDAKAALRTNDRGLECLLVVDSLEQVHGSLEERDELYGSVIELFCDYRDDLAIDGWHVIYTVPPWLKFTLESPRIRPEVFPHLALQDRTGNRVEANIALMRELLRLRLPENTSLETFFGNPSRRDAPLDLLITKSGGHIRDFFLLLRYSITAYSRLDEDLPIRLDSAKSAVHRLREHILPISLKDAELMDRIVKNPADLLEGSDKADVMHGFRLLNNHLVFTHRNGEEWYEVHPLILGHVEERLNRSISRKIPAKKAVKKKAATKASKKSSRK